MKDWIGRNGAAVALYVPGLVMVGLAVGPAADRGGLAFALVGGAVGLMIAGGFFSRLEEFKVGPRGFEGKLSEVEKRIDRLQATVDQIVRLPRIESQMKMFPPTVRQDEPPESEEGSSE